MINSKQEIEKLTNFERDFFKSFVYEWSDEIAVVFDSEQGHYIIVDIVDLSLKYNIIARLNLDKSLFRNYYDNVDTFYLKDLKRSDEE
ncbi:hypothetical protein MGH68_12095 [Erysipelothrix sp. D19-032]